MAGGKLSGRVRQPRITVAEADLEPCCAGIVLLYCTRGRTRPGLIMESPTVIVPRSSSPFQCHTLLNFNSRSSFSLRYHLRRFLPNNVRSPLGHRRPCISIFCSRPSHLRELRLPSQLICMHMPSRFRRSNMFCSRMRG